MAEITPLEVHSSILSPECAMTKERNQYFEKLKVHLPLVKDPTVIVLRGHLLVEELLDELISASFEHPSAIKDARLTFSQKLCICQAIIGRSGNEDIWRAIKELNCLRNVISHKLPDSALSAKLNPLLKVFFGKESGQIPADLHSQTKALRKGIIFHCAMLNGFIEGMSVVKKRSSWEPGIKGVRHIVRRNNTF